MRKLLKNRNFLILWQSQISSLLTINVLNFLVIVRIFEQTNSSIASSFIWVAYSIPAIIVGPFAAAAVDIVDRRKLVVAGNLFQAVIVLLYSFLYQEYLFLSYGVIALYSLVDQLYVPAEMAILTKTVSKDDLVTANSIFFISQQTTTILAFGLAGLANEILGFQITAIIASIFLFSAFAGTLFLPKQPVVHLKVSGTMEDKLMEFLLHMKDGFHFIRHTNVILYPFFFLVWLQVSMSILVVNLPAIATEIVMTKPALAGPLVVIPAGAGAVIGTLLVTKLVQKRFRKKDIVHTGLLVLVSAFFGVSILLPMIPFWIGRFLLVVLFFGAGGAFVSTLVPTLSFMQEKTPKHMAGRVFGNFWFITNALTVLPVIFSATLTEVLGARLMLLSLGFATLCAFLISNYYVSRKKLLSISTI